MRELLLQALDALEMHVLGFDGVRKMELAIEALEAELAKPDETETLLCTAPPKQEEGCSNCAKKASDGWVLMCVACAEKALAPEQKPTAFVTGYKNGHCVIAPTGGNTIFQTGLALYTAPPKREWVGLTDQEINEFWENNDIDWESIKRVEAKIKEKNDSR